MPAEARVIDGVRVTHPDKLLWPEDGISKGELADYQAAMAPVMLRYVRDRPLTLRPFPRGIDAPGFYLKDAPKGAPAWLTTFTDVAESTGKPVRFVVAADARTLVWLAQYNAPEVHAWLSRVDEPDRPDWGMVDLDPFEGTPWQRVAQAGAVVHELLAEMGLQAFAKTSGQSGLHVLVPLAREAHSFDDVRAFFEGVAREAAKRAPELLTADYHTADRGGRILFDYAQNARGKTTVAPYSVRPKPGAPVSAPVRWEELDEPGMSAQRWTLRDMPARLQAVGDILEPALKLKQRLP